MTVTLSMPVGVAVAQTTNLDIVTLKGKRPYFSEFENLEVPQSDRSDR